MTETKRLLAIKAQLKKRQPKYGRQESYLKKLDQTKWRTPKGLHIKVGDRGNPAMLEKGYGTPRAVRGMTKLGLYPVRVATIAELEKLNPKTQCATLGKVGGKRRIELIEAAGKKGIQLANASEKVATQLKERFTTRANERKQKSAARAKKLEEKLAAEKKSDKKQAEKKETADEKKTEDES